MHVWSTTRGPAWVPKGFDMFWLPGMERQRPAYSKLLLQGTWKSPLCRGLLMPHITHCCFPITASPQLHLELLKVSEPLSLLLRCFSSSPKSHASKCIDLFGTNRRAARSNWTTLIHARKHWRKLKFSPNTCGHFGGETRGIKTD